MVVGVAISSPIKQNGGRKQQQQNRDTKLIKKDRSPWKRHALLSFFSSLNTSTLRHAEEIFSSSIILSMIPIIFRCASFSFCHLANVLVIVK